MFSIIWNAFDKKKYLKHQDDFKKYSYTQARMDDHPVCDVMMRNCVRAVLGNHDGFHTTTWVFDGDRRTTNGYNTNNAIAAFVVGTYCAAVRGTCNAVASVLAQSVLSVGERTRKTDVLIL